MQSFLKNYGSTIISSAAAFLLIAAVSMYVLGNGAETGDKTLSSAMESVTVNSELEDAAKDVSKNVELEQSAIYVNVLPQKNKLYALKQTDNLPMDGIFKLSSGASSAILNAKIVIASIECVDDTDNEVKEIENAHYNSANADVTEYNNLPDLCGTVYCNNTSVNGECVSTIKFLKNGTYDITVSVVESNGSIAYETRTFRCKIF